MRLKGREESIHSGVLTRPVEAFVPLGNVVHLTGAENLTGNFPANGGSGYSFLLVSYLRQLHD